MDLMSEIDNSVPHSARIFNYWLGGKDHYPVDRQAGESFMSTFPQIVDLARTGRHFLARVVRYLAGEAGIRQFLDIGTGLPTVDNTHEIAQRVTPGARIVYVDSDPLVLVHARALLTSTPQGATDYIQADLREPEKIIEGAARTLDFAQPVALILMGVLAHIDDYDEARSVVARLLAAVPPGSYLAVRDGADTNSEYSQAIDRYNRTGAAPYRLRSLAQIAGYLDGLDIVEPGLVSCPLWRPEVPDIDSPVVRAVYGAVGRKT
jgi:O-methyltransferase involved in polyketide biosynthesis